MPGRHASTPRKEKREEGRKGIKTMRVKHPTPSQATDALTEEKKKETELGPQPSYPGPFSHLLRREGSYSEPILFTPRPTKD